MWRCPGSLASWARNDGFDKKASVTDEGVRDKANRDADENADAKVDDGACNDDGASVSDVESRSARSAYFAVNAAVHIVGGPDARHSPNAIDTTRRRIDRLCRPDNWLALSRYRGARRTQCRKRVHSSPLSRSKSREVANAASGGGDCLRSAASASRTVGPRRLSSARARLVNGAGVDVDVSYHGTEVKGLIAGAGEEDGETETRD